jgi:hypothetical protein
MGSSSAEQPGRSADFISSLGHSSELYTWTIGEHAIHHRQISFVPTHHGIRIEKFLTFFAADEFFRASKFP